MRFHVTGLILLFSALFSCNPPTAEQEERNASIADNIIGTYQYIEDSGNARLRHWGMKYWELEINKASGRLSYNETGRGLYSFDLAIKPASGQKTLYIKFDSIIYSGSMRPAEITNTQREDTIAMFSIENNKLETRSPFFSITRDTLACNRIVFEKLKK